jgi:hypothetical protein
MNHLVYCAGLIATSLVIGCGGETSAFVGAEHVAEVQPELSALSARHARSRLSTLGERIDLGLPLTSLPNDAELTCTPGRVVRCTSGFAFPCPSGWTACSAAGAATCCEKAV